jgi:hypothetical protein
MTHYGTLGSHRFSEEETGDDIRGTSVYGSDDQELGEIVDVIFNHDTMEVRYVVIDSGGWLEAGRFILPADRIFADDQHPKDFSATAARAQIQNSPRYDEKSLTSASAEDREKYEEEYEKFWHAAPVMHRHGTDRNITPPETELEEPISADTSSTAGASRESEEAGPSLRREITAAELFPERLADKFSDPAPGSGKITMRPQGTVSRAEDAAYGATLFKPHWWESFANLLRRNRDDIQAGCSQCGHDREQMRDAA